MANTINTGKNKPDRYAVIGNPIAHSKSPEIHLLFAEQVGRHITYEKIQANKDGFAQAATSFFEAGGLGLNVTLPFKRDAYNFVNQHTDFAQHAGAVNTIIRQGANNYLGANTDGIGLLRDLKKTLRLRLLDKSILIIGAGGATKGIVEPLLHENPVELIVANRTVGKAAAIADDFRAIGEVQSCSLNQIPSKHYDLVLHATSAALRNNKLVLPTEIIGPKTYCYDLSYSDSITPFIQWAKAHGATNVVDGFGMLLEQAAESFYLWHGKRPDTAMVYSYLRPKP